MRTIIAVLALGGCGALAPAEQSGGPPAALVEVTAVEERTLDETLSFLGDVRALSRAELAAGATGQVVRVLAREGDAVEAGALLVQVDPALAQAGLRAARAAVEEGAAGLAEARAQADRLARVAEGVVAAHDVEQAQARLRGAEARHATLIAAVDRARAELERHGVRAPFAGVLAARRVDPGDWVVPGRPVADLVSSEAVEVVVAVPGEVLHSITRDQAATLLARPPVPGRVAGIVPALDPATRTGLVRVVPEARGTLVPGSGVQVTFQVTTTPGLVVPRDAVISGPAGDRVARVVGDAVDLVAVEVVATTAADALVRGDLRSGDTVVIRGNERLRPGQAVRLATP